MLNILGRVMRAGLVALIVMNPTLADDAASTQGAKDILAYLDRHAATYKELAQDIWHLAELGYIETESSQKLQARLKREGFKIQSGVADIPTAFVASYGKGTPVIALLAEFDALPGISQAAVGERQPIPGKPSGHACGHHLFGAGSTAAAVAVKHWMARHDIKGKIVLYGTPAEEGGSGKVYMVRAGLFDDVDVVLHWHPSDRNAANAQRSLANRSARFKFTGVSSHAAAAPERGRSALDGVEAMNFMANLLREHIPQESRLHYVITQGGEAPNVVPDYAEAYYYVRHPQATELQKIWDRVVKIAQAAALGTGTDVAVEVMHGNHPVLPNEALAQLLHKNLTMVGGVTYNDAERRFAQKISQTLNLDRDMLGGEGVIQPSKMLQGMGSTDVGDVSWVVPTGGLRAATWVPGTSAHTWQAVAAGGTSIGNKGMQVAARTLALTAKDLFLDAELIAKSRTEFDARRGRDFTYKSLLGDRAPPLDYRLK